MSIGEIETLEIGTKVSYFCENVREVRTIEKHPFEDSLIARSSYGTYMPISKETQEKYKYQIDTIYYFDSK